MIFKTYTSDLDGLSNKLGFNKRSFAEWGAQVSQSFNDAGRGLNGFKSAFVTAFKVISNTSEIKLIESTAFNSLYGMNAQKFFEGFNKYGSQSISTLTQWCGRFDEMDKTMKAYLVDCMQKQVPASFEGYNNYVQSAIDSTQKLTLATKAGQFAIKAFSVAANMIAFQLIFKGIQFATKALDNWINRSKYAIEAMEQAQQSINDAQNTLKDVSTTIEENKDRFLELSEGVDKFSKNIKLSEKDYAEYLSISNKLAEISPELITGYTDQGDALLYIGDNAEETSEKLNKILEAEQALAQQSLVDNMDSVARGIYYEVDKANSDIANLKAELNTVSTVFRDLDNIIKTVDNDISSIDFGTGSGINLDFNEMEQLKNAIRNSGAKITEDDVFDSMIFSSSDAPLVQKAIENFYKQLDSTRKNESSAYINGITKDIQESEKAIKDAYAKMAPNLVAWAKSTYEYDFLGEQQKELIESLIPTLDWNDIKEKTGMKLIGSAEYEQYIRENIIVPLMSIPDEYQDEVNKKFAKLLEFESGDIDLVNFASELQEYLDSIGVTIDIKPLLGDTVELKDTYEQITTDAANKFIEKNSKNYALLDAERQALDDFTKQNSINTRDEIAFWNQCLEESNTREQAMEKYLGGNTANENPISSLSITETVDQINTQLKPAFDSLKSAYQDIFTFDDDTGEKLFSLDDIGIDTFESIRSTLDDLSEIDGITVDYSSFEDFVSVLSNSSSTADEVQAQFDRLATSIIYTTDCTNISADTYDLLVKSLKNLGITNAEEVLSNLKDIQEELINAGYNLSDVTADEAAKLVELGLVTTETAEYLNQYLVQKELAQNPLSTIADIQALEDLCNALGITGELYENVIALKNAFDAKERGAVSAGLDESIKHYQNKISELANGKSDYKFSFDGADTPKSSSKSSSSSSKETDAWLEEYKKKLAELQNRLDKGRLMPSPVVMQDV